MAILFNVLYACNKCTTFFHPESDNESNGDDIVDGAAPTPKRHRLVRVDGLLKALMSGLYPKFLGVTGPVSHFVPLDNSSLDFLKIIWPASLCEHIAVETNTYARHMGGVDSTGQMRKTCGYDRKSKRYWLRLFFHCV